MIRPNFHYELEQGSDEWLIFRSGMVTGTGLEAVLAGGTGATRYKYLCQIAAERETRIPTPFGYENQAMRDGKEREPEGRRFYEERLEVIVEQIGFICHPSIPWFGCSPDGIILEDPMGRGLELKCPELHTFMDRVVNGTIPRGYTLQMQGLMECAALESVDFVNYFPGRPLLIQRVYRDEKLIKEIISGVKRFNDDVEELRAKMATANYLRLEKTA